MRIIGIVWCAAAPLGTWTGLMRNEGMPPRLVCWPLHVQSKIHGTLPRLQSYLDYLSASPSPFFSPHLPLTLLSAPLALLKALPRLMLVLRLKQWMLLGLFLQSFPQLLPLLWRMLLFLQRLAGLLLDC